MGTRADFYVGRGPEAEWIGSIAWDGYPSGLEDHESQYSTSKGGSQALRATTEEAFREGVHRMGESRKDFTPPERGWPWPWDDSGTTDYAYFFDGGKVYASAFGRPYFEIDVDKDNGGEPLDEDAEPLDEGERPIFPNMKDRQNVRLDAGSGVISI